MAAIVVNGRSNTTKLVLVACQGQFGLGCNYNVTIIAGDIFHFGREKYFESYDGISSDFSDMALFALEYRVAFPSENNMAD